jgi:hypothetical protein
MARPKVEIQIPKDLGLTRFGLGQLLDDGFIALSSSPLMWEEPIAAAQFSLPPKSTNTQQPWPTIEGES